MSQLRSDRTGPTDLGVAREPPSHRERVPPPPAPESIAAAAVALGGLVVAFVILEPAGLGGLATAESLTRWVVYVATLLSCGGVLFLWLIHDGAGGLSEHEGLRSRVQIAAVVAIYAALAGLFLHGAVFAGLTPGDLLAPRGLARAAVGALQADLQVRSSVFVRLVGLAIVVVAIPRASSRIAIPVAVVGAVAALWPFVLVGHSATSEPRALVVSSSLLHTLAAAGWLGGLVLLALTLRYRRVQQEVHGAAVMIARFSTFAAISVGALTVTGMALAAVELSALPQLWTSAYGWTLLTKVGLVGYVLVVAAYNHRYLVPAIKRGGRAPWGTLQRTVGCEIAGLVVVLLATAVLVGLMPPQP